MLFTKRRANRQSTAFSSSMEMNFVSPPVITFSAKYRNQLLNPNPVVPINEKEQTNNENGNSSTKPPKKTMKWGEPTWFLFHTLAEKIKPEYFTMLRQDLFQMIHQICSNLPCPICATHAKQYLASTNFANITTKDHLRLFFHTFHNTVNQRKGYAIFPMEELSEKYGKANTVNIINHFMTFFEDSSTTSHRMISDSLFRKRIVSILRLWFNKNIQYFDQ